MRFSFWFMATAYVALCAPSVAQTAKGPVSGAHDRDRQRALAELKMYHFGCTLTPDRRSELESISARPHEKDARLIAAYRYEALAAAYWLFCIPPRETDRATPLQIYLADTTTLQGRDDGVPPPQNDVDGLRGCRVVYRRFVRCDGEAKPYFMTAYGIIPFQAIPGQGVGKQRVKARLVPIGPPDNLRIRTEIDDGVFVGLPFDFDQGKLHPHVHFNPEDKPCLFGAHGETLACGRGEKKPRAPVIRVDANVASAHVCSSCHMDGTSSMVDAKRFLLPRDRMEGYLLFPKLAQLDAHASKVDLDEIRAQLRDPSNTFIPADLPKAIEDAWVECYTDFMACKAAMAKLSPSN
jgi:hypothetical protein